MRPLKNKALQELAGGPGIDPRTWLSYGRIDDDPDAIRWLDEEDGPCGWIVDVTFIGGPLDGEGPVACRLGSSFSSPSGLRSDPPARDSLVVVSLPGNANEDCTVVRVLPTLGFEPPTTVNGVDITEEFALTHHFLVTPHGVEEEIGGDRRVAAAGKHSMHGETIELGADNAGQEFVRGSDLEDALNGLADAVNQIAIAVGAGLSAITVAGGGPAIGTTYATALTAFQASVAQFKATAVNYKSQRIKGE